MYKRQSLVRCYPIGVITMQDQGKMDEKIIAIPFEDPTYNTYRDISELPSHISVSYTHLTHLFQDFFPPFFKQVGGIAALGTLGIAALQQRVQRLQ